MLLDIPFAIAFAIGLSQSTADCPACKAADTRGDLPVRLVIEEGSVTLIHDHKAARSASPDLPPGAMAISCRKLRFDGEQTHVKLACTEASFTTGDGMEGRAAELLYDSSKRSLHLRGADGKEVKLFRKSNTGGIAVISATEVKIDLQRSRVNLRDTAAVELFDSACCCKCSACRRPFAASGCHDGDPESLHRIPNPLIAPVDDSADKPWAADADSKIFRFSVGIFR